MANGGYWKSDHEWRRVEAPLLEVDSILCDFADEFALQVTKNHKGWPERSFVWGDSVRRLIQLYLMDEKRLTFNLWICASQDRGGKRFWKHGTPIKGQPIVEFKDELPALLREGRRALESWGEADLEFGTDLNAP